jgi:endogenous inhibitor of DNA gyrase (YacG/DUF329 family)
MKSAQGIDIGNWAGQKQIIANPPQLFAHIQN